MKTNITSKFNNEYTLQLRDITTGKIKQEIKTHNVVLNNLWSFRGLVNQWNIMIVNTRYIAVGSGTGTPAATDKDLFHRLWIQQGSTTTETSPDGKTLETVIVTTFPADTSHVADITEVGIAVNLSESSSLVTHALLQDAEGNPITMHKGDLDELIVTATIRFTMGGGGFTPFPYDRTLLGSYFISDRNADRLCLGKLSLQRSPLGYSNFSRSDADQTLYFSPNIKYSTDTHKFTITNGRIAADRGNTHYYNSLVLDDFGYWALPNPDIFPYYDIEDISLGIGDGVTTNFDNPLNYFVKDSERITKNGVLLTRDVDYTIDYHNNKDMLSEISQALQANIHSALDDRINESIPFFHPNDGSSHIFNDVSGNGLANRFSKNDPLFIDFEEATTINTIKIASLCVNYYVNDSYQHATEVATSAIFKFSYSNDGEYYTEILTTENFDPHAGKTFTFPDIKAKYFKIEILDSTDFDRSNWYYLDSNAGLPTCNDCFIGRVGDPYIRFTTPPEEGAELKMTVQMDRPFKNNKFVIDFTGEIELS